MVAAGEVEGLPVIATKRDIGGGRRTVDDAPELLSRGIEDPDTAGAATIDIALGIDLHAVGNARLGAA